MEIPSQYKRSALFLLVTVLNRFDWSRPYIVTVHCRPSEHKEGWENLRKSCKPKTQLRVCITFENVPSLPAPRVFR